MNHDEGYWKELYFWQKERKWFYLNETQKLLKKLNAVTNENNVLRARSEVLESGRTLAKDMTGGYCPCSPNDWSLSCDFAAHRQEAGAQRQTVEWQEYDAIDKNKGEVCYCVLRYNGTAHTRHMWGGMDWTNKEGKRRTSRTGPEA